MKRQILLAGLMLFGILTMATLAACQPQDMTVTIVVDNGERRIVTQAATVREVLDQAGVSLGPLDRVEPDLYVEISPNLVIEVTRVQEKYEVETVTLPYEHKTVTNEALPAGETRLIQLGVNGQQEITYRRLLENGVEVERSEVSRTITGQPVDEIMAVGARDSLPPVQMPGTVAYLSAGNAWIMRDTSTARRPLTSEGDLDGRVFELSPDGRRLLYTRRLEGSIQTPINELWLVNTTIVGEDPISLPVRGVLYAQWSPNGSQIAYSTAERTTSPPGWQANNDLWLMAADADVLTQATQVVTTQLGTDGPLSWWGASYQWSPDGSKFAYGSADEIGVLDVVSNTKTVLTDFPVFNTYSEWVWTPSLSWSPDGRFLAATVHGAPLAAEDAQDSQVFDLWFFSADGQVSAQIADQVGMWAYPSWGEAGVMYGQTLKPLQSVDSRYELVLRDNDGSNPRRIFPASGEPGVEAPPQLAWGPDEDAFLFVYNGNLYLGDVNGALPRQLTSNNQNSLPRWRAGTPRTSR